MVGDIGRRAEVGFVCGDNDELTQLHGFDGVGLGSR